jgi:hypothetical protein
MKKLLLLVVGLCLCSAMALAADQTYNGWVSDSKCGVKGASASHAQCAKGCIGKGEKPVLVTDKDQKVVSIDNPDAISDHAGEHVQVSGKMTDSGALHVGNVKTLSE